MRAMTTKGCWDYGYATQLSHMLGKAAIKPRFADDPWVRKFVAQDSAFEHRPARPLLVGYYPDPGWLHSSAFLNARG